MFIFTAFLRVKTTFMKGDKCHCFCPCVLVCVGITQDRIDECRGAREKTMLADIQVLVQSGADLNARDDNGATLVRQRDT